MSCISCSWLTKCRNYATCPCRATSNTCGARQSCEAGGCQGSINNMDTRAATCKGAYLGCACNPSGSTPQHCPMLGPCTFNGCNGYRVNPNDNIGICTSGPQRGCGCIPERQTPTPPPTWDPPPQPPADPPLSYDRVCWASPPTTQCLCYVSAPGQWEPVAVLPEWQCSR